MYVKITDRGAQVKRLFLSFVILVEVGNGKDLSPPSRDTDKGLWCVVVKEERVDIVYLFAADLVFHPFVDLRVERSNIVISMRTLIRSTDSNFVK